MRLVLPAQLKPVLAQVRANPRLQAGLALVVVLLLGWVFLVLGDLRDAQLQLRDQARERYVQVRLLVGQDVWLQRADEATRLADALDAEIPRVQSAGLAQAAFQGWLKGIVDGEGDAVRMQVQTPAYMEDPADVVRVTAVVSGGISPRRAWQMIHRIESGVSLVTIPLLTVKTDGANNMVSVTVQGYYRLPGPPPQVQP